MSVAFVQQKNRLPPNPAQIQKILDENAQLIQAIVDYQNKGKANECGQYQQILHRNLVYLASMADANQNIQALLPPPQSGLSGPSTHMPPSGQAPVSPMEGSSNNGPQTNAPGILGPNSGQGPMHGMHHTGSYPQQQGQHHVPGSGSYMRAPMIPQGQAVPPGQQYSQNSVGPMSGQYPAGQQYSVGQQYPASGTAMPPPGQQNYPQVQQAQYRPQQAGYPPQPQQPNQYGSPANAAQPGSFIAPNHQHGHQNYGAPASQSQTGSMNYSGQVGGYNSNPTPAGAYILPSPQAGYGPQGHPLYNQPGQQAPPAPTSQGSYRPPSNVQSNYGAVPPSTVPAASQTSYGPVSTPQSFTATVSQPQQAYGGGLANQATQGYPPTSGTATSPGFPQSQSQEFVPPMPPAQQGFGPANSQSGSGYGTPSPQAAGYSASGTQPASYGTNNGAGPQQPVVPQPTSQLAQPPTTSTPSIPPQQGSPSTQQSGPPPSMQPHYGHNYGPSPPQAVSYSHYRLPGPTPGTPGQGQMPPPPSSTSSHPGGGPPGQRPYLYEQNQYPSYQPQ